jgi:hypothetical protein
MAAPWRSHNPPPTLPKSEARSPSPSATRFKPNQMLLEQQGNVNAGKFRRGRKTNDKYLGDTQSKSYRSMVRGLPDSENCSLWVSNISPRVQYADILSKAKSGAVFSLHLTARDDDHCAATATFVFKKHQAAEDFITQINSENGV